MKKRFKFLFILMFVVYSFTLAACDIEGLLDKLPFDIPFLEQKEEYNIYFYVEDEIYHEITIKEGESFELPSEPYIEGKEFIGWYYASGEEFSIDFVINGNVDLYAKFEGVEIDEFITLYFYVDDKYFRSETYEYGDNFTRYPIPTKEGMLFDYWALSDGTKFDYHNKVTESYNLYAVFKKVDNPVEMVIVNFYVDDKLEKTQEYIKDEFFYECFTPYKEGYTFSHWEDKYGTKYDINTLLKDNVDLYAVFEKMTIELNKNWTSFDPDIYTVSKSYEGYYYVKYNKPQYFNWSSLYAPIDVDLNGYSKIEFELRMPKDSKFILKLEGSSAIVEKEFTGSGEIETYTLTLGSALTTEQLKSFEKILIFVDFDKSVSTGNFYIYNVDLIEKEIEEPIDEVEKLYVRGDMNSWGVDETYALIYNSSTDTASYTLKITDIKTNFKVANINWDSKYNFGSDSNGNYVNGDNTGNITVSQVGTYLIKVTNVKTNPVLTIEKIEDEIQDDSTLNKNWVGNDAGVYNVSKENDGYKVVYNKGKYQEWSALGTNINVNLIDYSKIKFELCIPKGSEFILKLQGPNSAKENKYVGSGSKETYFIDLEGLSSDILNSFDKIYIFIDYDKPSSSGEFYIYNVEAVKEEVNTEVFEYTLVNAVYGYYISNYSGNDTFIVIPSEYKNKPVYLIQNDTFSYSKVQEIIIPKSITCINAGAFAGCNELKSVYYQGTEADWQNVYVSLGNESLTAAMRYYYSETEPMTEGNYWHYVDDKPVISAAVDRVLIADPANLPRSWLILLEM